MITSIQTSSTNLLAVINDILDFSQIEQGAMILRPSRFELDELVQAALETITPAMLERKLDVVHLHETASIVSLFGDQGRIRQCVINLVSNAIKFSSDSIIIVRTRVDTAETRPSVGRLSIAVEDR